MRLIGIKGVMACQDDMWTLLVPNVAIVVWRCIWICNELHSGHSGSPVCFSLLFHTFSWRFLMVSCFALDRCDCTSFDVFQICWTRLPHRVSLRSPATPEVVALQRLHAPARNQRSRLAPQHPPSESLPKRCDRGIFLKRWSFKATVQTFDTNTAAARVTWLTESSISFAQLQKQSLQGVGHGGQDLIVPTEFISHISNIHDDWDDLQMWFEFLMVLFYVLVISQKTAKLLEPKLWSPAAPTPQRSVPCPAGSTTSHAPRPQSTQHLSFEVN